MVKYNVGEKVRIVSEPNWWWNVSGGMDKWCDKVMTVKRVVDVHGLPAYFMEEDATENCGDGWIWGVEDITESVKSETPDTKPMPELTTGTFGEMWDGERFVIVNDHVVYQQSGQLDDVWYVTKHPELVKALYDSPCCFGMIEYGVADVIWENPTPYVEDESDDGDDGDEETAKFIDGLIARLEKVLGDNE